MIVGLVAAVVTAAVCLALPPTARMPVLAGLLWLTVGLYIGMALMDTSRNTALEALGGVPVLALATLGLTTSPWFLVAGWLVHPAWDLLHPRPIQTRIHPWTVPFCIVYDVLVALLVALVATGGG